MNMWDRSYASVKDLQHVKTMIEVDRFMYNHRVPFHVYVERLMRVAIEIDAEVTQHKGIRDYIDICDGYILTDLNAGEEVIVLDDDDDEYIVETSETSISTCSSKQDIVSEITPSSMLSLCTQLSDQSAIVHTSTQGLELGVDILYDPGESTNTTSIGRD